MTNFPPTLLSERLQSTHINHGWWCTDCTDQLIAQDEQHDRTGEWLEALSSWSFIAGRLTGTLLIDIASGIVGLFMALAWIFMCLHDGFATDAREHEQQLHERDGLTREIRDDMNRVYDETLRDRQDVLKRVDQAKAIMAQTSGCSDSESLSAFKQASRDLNHNYARLKGIELEVLPELEGNLRCHRSV